MKKSKKPIHESIQALDISDLAKVYFNKLELYDIIEDKVVLKAENDSINEVMANRWSFRLDLKFCVKEDINAFYQALINSRRRYIQDQKLEYKMTFYTYYDGMSGNFYFSLIPSSKLLDDETVPFDKPVNIVESIDDIIQEFIDCPYKGVIPLSEFKILDPADYRDEDDEEIKWIPNVWSIILP